MYHPHSFPGVSPFAPFAPYYPYMAPAPVHGYPYPHYETHARETPKRQCLSFDTRDHGCMSFDTRDHGGMSFDTRDHGCMSDDNLRPISKCIQRPIEHTSSTIVVPARISQTRVIDPLPPLPPNACQTIMQPIPRASLDDYINAMPLNAPLDINNNAAPIDIVSVPPPAIPHNDNAAPIDIVSVPPPVIPHDNNAMHLNAPAAPINNNDNAAPIDINNNAPPAIPHDDDINNNAPPAIPHDDNPASIGSPEYFDYSDLFDDDPDYNLLHTPQHSSDSSRAASPSSVVSVQPPPAPVARDDAHSCLFWIRTTDDKVAILVRKDEATGNFFYYRSNLPVAPSLTQNCNSFFDRVNIYCESMNDKHYGCGLSSSGAIEFFGFRRRLQRWATLVCPTPQFMRDYKTKQVRNFRKLRRYCVPR